MPTPDINMVTIVVAAISSIIVGSLWYGPIFGKMWIAMMGFTTEQMEAAKKKGMGKTYLMAFIASLVTAYVLAHFVSYVKAVNAMGALQLAFWVWLGFVAPMLLSTVLWEGRKVKLYAINVGHYLVSLAVMSLILVLWK